MNKSGSAVVVDLETEERKSTSSDYNWAKRDDKDVERAYHSPTMKDT